MYPTQVMRHHEEITTISSPTKLGRREPVFSRANLFQRPANSVLLNLHTQLCLDIERITESITPRLKRKRPSPMSYTFSGLCWISAWMLLFSWIVSAKDIGVSSSTTLTNSSAPMGLHGYRRYFANDSLIGRPVPCTSDEKICFQHNLVFDIFLDKCRSLESLHETCSIRANTEEVEQPDELAVSCRTCVDPCSGYRMAYDGICYKKEIVRDVICGRDANITRHPFGNFECRGAPATQIPIKQPEENGSCVIPDFRFPDTESRGFFNNPPDTIEQHRNRDPLECGAEQSACFAKGKVFVQGFEGCHSFLKRGPCAEGHVVALDLQAATQGRAEGSCVDVRAGCPKGHKRMLFDGQCHKHREIKIEAPGDIILNQFGKYIIHDEDYLKLYPILKNEKCAIGFNSIRVSIISSNILSPCESPDGDDSLNHVVSEPPQPQF